MNRVLLIGFWILTATLVCSAQTTFYFPHVADGILGPGNVWKTTIFLSNPAASGTASGTITFTKENSNLGAAGSIFSDISFTDQSGAPAGSGGTITFSIPAGQARKYTSSGTAIYAGAFATVTTTAGIVTGTAVFSNLGVGGKLIAEGAVPAATAVPKQAIFVDMVGGFNVGVAYANPGSASAPVELSLLNSSGVSVATTTQTLGPGNHLARFTSQLFSGAPELVGTMQVVSTTPLSAIALRFDPTFSIFTTLPPFTLASVINPAMQWLDKRPWLAPLTSVARLLGALQLRIG